MRKVVIADYKLLLSCFGWSSVISIAARSMLKLSLEGGGGRGGGWC